MEGRKLVPQVIARSRWAGGLFAGSALAALLLMASPRAAAGQAMGQASLDDTPAPHVAPEAPVVAAATPAPVAATPAVTAAPSLAPAKASAPPTPGLTFDTPAPAAAATPASPAPAPLPQPGPLTSLAAPAATPPVAAAPPAPAPAAANPLADPSVTPPLTSLEQSAIRKPSTPQTTTSGGATTGSPKIPTGLAGVLQVAAALAVVIGLIFVGKAFAKKYVPGAKTAGLKGAIEILARHPLSKNQSIVLVRIGSQIVALNQGRDQSQSVLVISDATEVAKLMGQIDGQSPKSIQAGFNRLLANAAVDLQDSANDPEREVADPVDSRSLDDQLEEMAAARRQLMDLRTQVRSVREKLPRA